ncbi:uracil-DNA glycosylase [Paenibacillus shirakamiensis]|uniref:Uracil-DNA glycosylase n=1 Tax=Paenibacillus shirakamiensis TaxID=1265935 RepID=A0ABS4JC21_9BACL|nr:uracil-DNA glycosylase [Paenibacillus shirakamiensis]MBP1999266.1 uracil-DNA glycosylase [Paenibacillus shirakamiensis]
MFGNDWDQVLEEELKKPYFIHLQQWLNQEYEEHVVYPPRECVYEALRLTSHQNTRVVILGQDPYHGQGQAHGLSFSVRPGVRIPPSLRNIYKELSSDLSIPVPHTGTLTPWAEQGVLLLNNVLTVREGAAGSHQGKGWESFTDTVIQALNARQNPLVFILWGSHAQRKGSSIDNTRHEVIKSVHPSPLSARRGFFGSRPFSATNRFLEHHGQVPIQWNI